MKAQTISWSHFIWENDSLSLYLRCRAILSRLLLSSQPSITSTPSLDPDLVLRARFRLARQWLLRCLHYLMGLVFLHPLGVQQAPRQPSSPSASSSSDSRAGGGKEKKMGGKALSSRGRGKGGKVGDVLAEKPNTGFAGELLCLFHLHTPLCLM